MPLTSRLKDMFPEYTNQFSYQPRMNPLEAYDILDSFCRERQIDVNSIGHHKIHDFIEVLQFAPTSLSNQLIARRVGVMPTIPQPRIRVQPMTRARVEASQGAGVNLSELRQIGTSVQGISDLVSPILESDYARFISEVEGLSSNPSQEVEAMPTLEEATRPTEDTLDFWYNTSLAHTPRQPIQKKKRTRSELDMVREIVRGENFPRPNFKDWEDRNELERIYEDWNRNVEYREHWIFSRREREGFNRRQVSQFSLDDVMARLSKRKKPHVLDSSFSKFYDWKLGGTDWILRLELFQDKDIHFLIVRHIHRPTDTEIKFDVRYWSVGANQFKTINTIWTESTNREDRFERVFGSSNPDSPYYVEPYEEDEIEEDYDGEEDYEMEEWDEGDTF